MSPETNPLAAIIRTSSLHLAFFVSCPSLLLQPQVQGSLDLLLGEAAGAQSWGAAGAPPALPETSLHPPTSSFLSVPVPGGRVNFTV